MARLEGFRTLLLDSGCRPLRTLSWQRALTLDLQDRVDVLEYYDEVARTTSTAFQLPAVIRLRQYLRFLRFRVAFSRRNVFLRDAYQCQYCTRHPAARNLTLDHVLPRSRGGRTSWSNIVTACGSCNRRKGSRTPREANMPLLRDPVQPRTLPTQRGVRKVGDIPDEWREYLPAVGE